jgi:spore maturation protein CgeB
MKFVIFGLSVSSSWGNGHATLWRGLIRALAQRGHAVDFFERDVPYYARHRDLNELAGGVLHLYPDWPSIWNTAEEQLRDADASIVTSYCPDAIAASELVFESPVRLRVFYDLDTPVTLARLEGGDPVEYIGPRGLADYDLVLSFTGGRALGELESRLGARRAAALYGHADPAAHRPGNRVEHYRCDLSYLGTYAEDRQETLDRLFLEPARRNPRRRFCLAGAQYPPDFPWTENLHFLRHLPPPEHPGLYASSRLTLNVTRRAMARMGYCPSGRLFEAAACGVPIVTDAWEGLADFFEPGREIVAARECEDVEAALEMTDAELERMSCAARERVLEQYTSAVRAAQLEVLLEQAGSAVPTRLETAPAEV